MKKEHSPRYLAFIHFSIAAFAMPLLVFLIFYSLFFPLLGVAIFEPQMWFAEEILYFVALWFGIKYAAHVLPKQYTISNALQLARSATLYLAILSIVFWTFSLVTNQFDTSQLLFDIVLIAIELTLFYVLTRHYIKNS